LIPQSFLNIPLQFLGIHLGVISSDWLPITTDEELLKVPSDVTIVHWIVHESFRRGKLLLNRRGTGALQKLVQGMRICTVDTELICQGELGNEAFSRSHILQTEEDLLFGAWFLGMKLGAGSCDDGESLFFVLDLERIQI